MKKITTHLWFDREAKEAAAFYASLFEDAKVNHVVRINDTPSGDCDLVAFTLAGQEFMAINAGPLFKFNPSISLFVEFHNEADIDKTWNALIAGGKAVMPYGVHPWAQKYGWLQDKYGLSWQLFMGNADGIGQKISPLLMFTSEMAGKAREAIETYTGIFPNSSIKMVVPYEKGDGDQEGFLKHSRFTLDGEEFMATDSSIPHSFAFNEAISFVVYCETQEQIDYFSDKLSADPDSEQCGWLKDRYGVSWQIVPASMKTIMASGDSAKIARVTQAFLKMKRFDLAAIEKTAEGK